MDDSENVDCPVEGDEGAVGEDGVDRDVADAVETNVNEGVEDTVERNTDEVDEVGVYKGVEDMVGRGVAKVGEVGGRDKVERGTAKAGEAGPMDTSMKKVKIDIEKVREAVSHFKELPDDQQEEARRFFKAMDKDNNDLINVQEFRTFLTRTGFETENWDKVFKELDKDKNGALDFDELVTFFYFLSCEEYKSQLSRANTGGPDRMVKITVKIEIKHGRSILIL